MYRYIYIYIYIVYIYIVIPKILRSILRKIFGYTITIVIKFTIQKTMILLLYYKVIK